MGYERDAKQALKYSLFPVKMPFSAPGSAKGRPPRHCGRPFAIFSAAKKLLFDKFLRFLAGRRTEDERPLPARPPSFRLPASCLLPLAFLSSQTAIRLLLHTLTSPLCLLLCPTPRPLPAHRGEGTILRRGRWPPANAPSLKRISEFAWRFGGEKFAPALPRHSGFCFLSEQTAIRRLPHTLTSCLLLPASACIGRYTFQKGLIWGKGGRE